MKKLIVIFLFILIGGTSFSQSIVNRTNSSYTVQDSRFKAQYNLFVPAFADTTAANVQKGIDSLGAIIFTYDNMSLMVRTGSPKVWTAVGAGGGGGSGTVTSIGITGSDFTITNSPITTSGNIGLVLATVNSNVGTFGSATQASQFTVNGKGLITAASNVTITPAVGSITGLGTGVATALGVNVGSAGAFITFNGNAGTPSAIVLTNATGTASSLNIGGTAPAGSLTGTTLNTTVVTSSLTSVGTLTSGTASTGFVVGGVTMTLGSDASFDMYYRNGSGVLTRLANGTDNQVLTAHTGAAPTWEASAGGSSLFPTTGTGTATGAVIGNLDGNILSVQHGGNDFLKIDPTAGVESTTLQAYNTTGDDNLSAIAAETSDVHAGFGLFSSFNNEEKFVSIFGNANSTGSEIAYTADTHTFTGNFKSGSANAWDLDGNTLSVQQGGAIFLYIDPTLDAEQVAFQSVNPANNDSRLLFTTDATNAGFEVRARFDSGGETAIISGAVASGVSALAYTATTHTFTGAVTLNNAITLAAGTATAGTAPLYFTSGTDLTVPVSGAMEFDGVRFFTTTASGRGLSASEMFARVNSDFTLANSTSDQTLFPSNQNLWTLQGSTTYKVKFALRFTTGSTTHMYSFGFTLGGGASIHSMLIFCGSWVTAINATSTARTNTALDGVASTVVTANSTTSAFIEGEGYIVMNAGGTVEPIIKFSADPTGTCLLKANSYITFTPIGSNTVENVGNVQ